MENQPEHNQQRQWWTPVWKGLVLDPDAKHYRRLKSAVWLYLYFLLSANRATGTLMRKTRTISKDMGLSRDNVIRWMNRLRREGYIDTLSTGRYLTIRVNRWKVLVPKKHAETQPQMLEMSNSRVWKNPTPVRPRAAPIPDYFDPKTADSGPPNKKKTNKLLKNETYSMHQLAMYGPDERAFKSIGSCAHEELLAWELARALDDPAHIALYRSYCQHYPEGLLQRALSEVQRAGAASITKGRAQLFTNLLQQHAQGTTENPGR